MEHALPKKIGKEEALYLLRMLDEAVEVNNPPIGVFVCGGVSMAFFAPFRGTYDLDVISRGGYTRIIKEEADKLAPKIGATKPWLDIVEWPTPTKSETLEPPIFKGKNIEFFLPTKRFVLAMKIISASVGGTRHTKDGPDILFLMKDLDITTKDGLISLIEDTHIHEIIDYPERVIEAAQEFEFIYSAHKQGKDVGFPTY